VEIEKSHHYTTSKRRFLRCYNTFPDHDSPPGKEPKESTNSTGGRPPIGMKFAFLTSIDSKTGYARLPTDCRGRSTQ